MDGSVVIGVSLDTSSIAASAAQVESQLMSLGTRLNQSLTLKGDSGLGASITAMLGEISGAIASSSEGIGAAMAALASSAIAGFSSAGWAAGGQAAISGLLSGVNSGGAGVVSAAGSIANRAAAAFSGGSWSSIGANMMSGVASGILEAGAEIVSAIRQVAAEAEAAVKSFFKIQSPSALMRDEVGVMISRGIADGILSGGSYIGEAVAAVTSGLFDGAAPAMVLGAGEARMAGEYAVGGGYRGAYGGEAVNRSYVQNIYLRDSDSSPYETAQKIRRESEDLFRR